MRGELEFLCTSGETVDAVRAISALQPIGDAKRDALIQFVRHLQEDRGILDAEQPTALRSVGFPGEAVVDIASAIAVITFTNVFNRANDTVVNFPELK